MTTAAHLRRLLPAPLTPATRTAYHRMTGRHSREVVEARMMRRASEHPPVTYNEKMRYKMAFDRRPILTTFADKIAVRDYVCQRVGPSILSTVHAVGDHPRDIDWDGLPREFVVKVNHASGGMVIVWDGADPEAALPAEPAQVGWERLQVHPDSVHPERLTALMAHWLSRDYSWFPGKEIIEWAYQGVPHQLLVEELLLDAGRLPRDLKFTVVEGDVIWIQVDTNRFGAFTKDIMTPDWRQLPVEYNRIPRSPSAPPEPRHLEAMLEIARELGRGMDFIRVDLYELHDRIVFGELTNYPACGNGQVSPAHFDREWGRDWTCDYPAPATRT